MVENFIFGFIFIILISLTEISETFIMLDSSLVVATLLNQKPPAERSWHTESEEKNGLGN
ncbi:MAG TPA: hypothetical protein VJA22_03330 [Patescibacteria group bacterium]|nr:hypothetical protein [Patescibacteria group bacterium]